MDNDLLIDIFIYAYVDIFLVGFAIESFKDKSYGKFILLNMFSMFRLFSFLAFVSSYEVKSIIFPLIILCIFEFGVVISKFECFQ